MKHNFSQSFLQFCALYLNTFHPSSVSNLKLYITGYILVTSANLAATHFFETASHHRPTTVFSLKHIYCEAYAGIAPAVTVQFE